MKSSDRAGLPGDASVTTAMALTLSADRTRRVAIELLGQAGVEAILLKGPTLQWAWDPAPRPYQDVDLLIRPDQHTDAVEVLKRAGFVERATFTSSRHAATLRRGGDAPVDLHWTLATSGVSPSETWGVLRPYAWERSPGCFWLDLPGAASVAVLHAAQTPRGTAKLCQDVDAVVSDVRVLAGALEVADGLCARREFSLGLSITPAGVVASQQLGLEPPTRRAIARHTSAPLGLVIKLVRHRRIRAAIRLLWPYESDLPQQSNEPMWRLRRVLRGVRSSSVTLARGMVATVDRARRG